jgi:thiosulfate dehydrogenase [quinone] large subunit
MLTAINQGTAWGLTILGGLLLVGLFTRTSCVLAALFLLTTYFCTPPWPWFLAPPNTEGFYYYINKNVIEMLALVVLATTASGRWFGLDAVLHTLFKRSPRRPAPVPAAD